MSISGSADIPYLLAETENGNWKTENSRSGNRLALPLDTDTVSRVQVRRRRRSDELFAALETGRDLDLALDFAAGLHGQELRVIFDDPEHSRFPVGGRDRGL